MFSFPLRINVSKRRQFSVCADTKNQNQNLLTVHVTSSYYNVQLDIFQLQSQTSKKSLMTGKATGWIQTPGFKLGLREARTLPGELLICLNKFHVLVHRAHYKKAGEQLTWQSSGIIQTVEFNTSQVFIAS